MVIHKLLMGEENSKTGGRSALGQKTKTVVGTAGVSWSEKTGISAKEWCRAIVTGGKSRRRHKKEPGEELMYRESTRALRGIVGRLGKKDEPFE